MVLQEQPKKVKWKNIHSKCYIKVNRSYNEIRSFRINSFILGFQALESGFISWKSIESIRRVFTRYSGGKVMIETPIFPSCAVRATSTNSRIGKGNGKLVGWVIPIQRGIIFFEVCLPRRPQLRIAIKTARHKLGIKHRLVFGSSRKAIPRKRKQLAKSKVLKVK